MKILVGKTFGIGNAVMAVPMIKALNTIPNLSIDILVGDTRDDVGAQQVLSHMVRPPAKLYVNQALECDYDLAIMSMPFDGRWQNGVHFRAKDVWDGRTRPDPSTTGLVSWDRHEIDYQVDTARRLGFEGPIPDTSFFTPKGYDTDKIYLGVGYKKDAAGFWKVKHWGNENFAQFANLFLRKYQNKKLIVTGDPGDMVFSIAPIMRMVDADVVSRFKLIVTPTLQDAFDVISGCGAYVGNDTGMMHVAASCGIPTVGLFFMGPKSVTKAAPRWDENSLLCKAICLEDRAKVTPEYVLRQLEAR